jgi:hypothetical protein
LRQLEAIGDAARLGSGLVELTSRANLQIRGLAEGAGGPLAQVLGAGDLLPSVEHERVRNILADPGRAPSRLAAANRRHRRRARPRALRRSGSRQRSPRASCSQSTTAAAWRPTASRHRPARRARQPADAHARPRSG